MKEPARQILDWRRYTLALGAGLLLALAFPKFELAWLAWLAPGLILISALGQPTRKVLLLGYAAGVVQYLVPFYWLLRIPIPVRAVVAWLAVGGLMALYTVAWVWVCCRCFPKKFAQDNSSSGPAELADSLLSLSWRQRAVWAFTCAAAWVAMEMGIARILTGFPYSLGVSQFTFLPLIQIASVTGVYGVSFLIVWVSVALAGATLMFQRHRASHRAWLAEVAPPLAALAGVVAFGFTRLADTEPSGRELKVALVQPAIPQYVIWDPNEKTNRFNKLVHLSEQALAAQPELLVWPESALPNFMTRYNLAIHHAITNLVLPHKTWMILGANDFRARENSGDPPQVDWFNSSFLVHPKGELVARYHKRHLVVFGEYMPLGRWFSFLNRFRTLDRGFKSGDGPVQFQLTEPKAKIAVLICSEDVFPHLVREYVEADTDFLLNLTNDGWFGDSAAQWQHAVDALFRAVENGLPLVRCTNNGLTCWIDSHGRLHEVYFPGTRDIYGAGFKLARIPLLPVGEKRPPTFYRQYGDWFGWGCVVLTAVMLIRNVFQRGDRVVNGTRT
ncbi:MAG: apolipoprotein N-acyltransferase [Verrucomicrobia bacterium]|nr:apolipoprotein N-acyltransferase [Verrucomicrobiota bacterium]